MSEDRYHICCNNIPKSLLKMIEEDNKSKTPRKKEAGKRGNLLLPIVSPFNRVGRQKAVLQSLSAIDESPTTPSKRKKVSQDEQTSKKRGKKSIDPSEIGFCGFRISF
jgi:hypothetical protein